MAAVGRTAVAALLLASGCGGLSSQPPGEDLASIADAAKVICDQDGTRLLTTQVRPQADGVHIRIESRLDREDVSFVVGQLGGSEAAGEQVWPIPPGTVEIGCWVGFEEEPDYVPLEVVDSQGLYVPAELDCLKAVGSSGGGVASSGGSFGEAPEGDPRDPVEIAREFFESAFGPLGADDVVERAGYPQAEIRQVRLVRDGKTVAVAEYADASFAGGEKGSGWIGEGYQACSSLA
jgi:hypothetical protein